MNKQKSSVLERCAGVRTRHSSNSARSALNSLVTSNKLLVTRTAFTMAEILLSLTIIGVVAAITLPSLTGNINERTWNTQRKALYSRMSQAISLMPALNNFGTLNDTTDTAAETFITSGLAKVLKINNICTSNYQDCGIVTSYADMLGSKKSIPTTLYSLNGWFSIVQYNDTTGATCSYKTHNTNAVAFETQNGENIIAYYNKTCRTEYLNQTNTTMSGNSFGFPESTMCVNFIYDLNGKKGPNTVGKDIGIITVFNATDSIIVAPIPSSTTNANNNTPTTWNNAVQACSSQDNQSRLPNIDELSSMLINKDIINLALESSVEYWSNTLYNPTKAWKVTSSGRRGSDGKNYPCYVRCIKR